MLHRLPEELHTLINSFVDDHSVVSLKHLKANARTYLSLLLTTKCSQFEDEIQKCKRIIDYLLKYPTYQNMYELDLHYYNNEMANPILSDILFTGLNIPYSRSTFDTFNADIQNDLHAVLKLIPSSVHSDYCHLRCRTNITPLYIACINETIPLWVVQLLIDHGADKDHRIKLNGRSIGILKDIKSESDPQRFDQLVELFS